MAQITLIGPDTPHLPLNTADETAERGWNPKHLIDSMNTMFAEIYASGAIAFGRTLIDFGAFPGKSDVSLDITGQTLIVAGSAIEAWIQPLATDDHTADEHIVDAPIVYAGNIVAGTGFTIYAVNASGGDTRAYGKWSVAWRWQ